MAEDNGIVHYVHHGQDLTGGMINAHDRAAFAGRHVARLVPHLRANGKAGYKIIATSGEVYEPQAETVR
jgi:hypothetical protein